MGTMPVGCKLLDARRPQTVHPVAHHAATPGHDFFTCQGIARACLFEGDKARIQS